MDPTTHTQLEDLMSHSDWLRALARRLVGDPGAADDLVQETWLAAMRRPPDPDRPARPWLAGVMRRLVAMRARGEARRVRRQHAAAQPEALPSTADMVEELDTQRRIAQIVLDLDEPYRTTVLLRYYRQMSAAEIARRQGIPAGTVRWRLRRGLEELREELDREWSDRRSWCLALVGLERAWQGAGVSAGIQVTSGAGLSWLSFLTTLQWSALLLLTGVLGWLGLTLLARDVALERGPALPSTSADTHADVPVDRMLPAIDGAGPEVGRTALIARGGESPAATVPAERTHKLRLLNPDGSSGKGLQAVLIAGDGRVSEGVTDHQGFLDAGPIDRAATLYVKRPDAFLERMFLEAHWPIADGAERAGDVVLRLTLGSELSGRLSVAGRAPEAGLALSLTRDQPLFGEEDAPEPVRERIRSARIAHCRTAQDGSFRFVGLAADWHGTLRLPRGYRFADAATSEGRVMPISGPATGLRLALDAGRQLTGRLAGLDDRAAIAQVECVFEQAGGRTTSVVLETDRDGCFRTAIRPSFVRVVVRARAPGLVGLAAGTLAGEGHVDLGSVELQRGRRMVVEVEGAAGRPLVGADVGALASDGSGPRWTGQTDSAGQVELDLPAGMTFDLTVDALGYRGRQVVAGHGERLRIGLSASPLLRVRVIDAGGRGRKTSLRIAGQLFVTDRTGSLETDELDGDERLEIQALGPLGNVLATESVELIGPNEYDLELRMDTQPAVFAGSVRDDTGRAVVGAAIRLTEAGGESWRLRTDREGNFSVQHGEFGPVRVEVSKAGFEDLVLVGVGIASGQERDFVLRTADRE